MKVDQIPKLAVIDTTSADDFQEQFNSKMLELSGFGNLDYQLFVNGDSFRAIITYTETVKEFNSVADEFHAEGIRYLCKHCPHLEDPRDRRVKYCKCKYAELGATHKQQEACEIFYRQLKAGTIEPLEDYMR